MNQEKRPLYFIALMPPAKIRDEIDALKKEIKEKHHVKHALKLPAHITLQIPFRMPEIKERILIKKIEKFSAQQQSFNVELEGFGKFAKNVIFVKIKDHEPFIELHRNLQDLMLNFLDLKSHEISSNIHPHITLATRDLKRSTFPAVWNDFKDREYSVSFKTDHLFILKHNGKTWDIFRKFKLDT
ncbi:2'-5' RNA ligase family protein [Gramella jeungdoensis]|uniref:2'-5' RNA ligase family protein n=1 Tax=Gramella jeungdoensis TaxID=708091 RepID=A0ABT0Z4F7_9FLAO|nr:2'-5' RNA ligase family protein [Gramella jeungdoensis]MCM8570608.1 2'-5' RNA ligase family protein [Gramella jeungdoensis]